MMKIFAALAFLLFCYALLYHRTEAELHQDKHVNSDINVPQKHPEMPAYHFRPPKNWMNDPNGPMYFNGVYHLFFQYNPEAALFGDKMVWGHSISHDLINWKHLGIGLEPSEPFDINSCWSGSTTIVDGNKPIILYTGIDKNHNQVQNLAEPKDLSDPYLREWVKISGNPVMDLPKGIDGDKFRDPSTAWQGADGIWRVIVGSQINIKDDEGMVLLYKSKDFTTWSMYEQPLYSGKKGMWECPDFFPVYLNSTNGVDTSVQSPAVKHVMKAGFFPYAVDCYLIGTYDHTTESFVPENEFTGTSSDLRYDYGKYYASKSFFDSAKSRRIMLGWANESDSENDDIRKGWSGLQAFPRKVWLSSNGRQLVQWPIEEVKTLHGKEVNVFNEELKSGSVFEVQDITGSQADVEISFELPNLEEADSLEPNLVDPQLLCSKQDASFRGGIGPFGLLTLASKDLTEQTAVFFRIFKGQSGFKVLMCSDQSRSSLKDNLDKTTYGAFVDVDPETEKISLRSLIDHSIVESFGGEGRTCITARVYPTLALGKHAHLYAFNNGTSSVVISKLSAWSMKEAQMINEEDPRYKASQ